MRAIEISKKKIGNGEPTFIIAEAGSNHNGKLDVAKRLIDTAVEAGADAVKFQTFRADKLYPKEAGYADYLETKKSIYDIIKEMEMPYEWIPELFDYCKENDIIFLASSFDEDSANKLTEVGVEAFKIASYESNHLPLIRHVAKKGKPIIMSTGLATIGEIEESLDTIYSQGNEKVVLMHCVAKYPAPLEHMNLRVIETLKRVFDVAVGMSDHTRDPFTVPLAAVAIGANAVEKHFTLDNNLPGPDHKFAVEPDELKAMTEGIRGIEKALGSQIKKITPVEEELFKFARRRVHAIKNIKKGEIFSEKNIAILRSGKLSQGMAPKFWDLLIGKAAADDIAQGEGVTFGKVRFDFGEVR